MPKYFTPNLPQRNIQTVSIYTNKITLTGTSGTANITINGVINTTIATFSSTLTATAAAWVAANFTYYYALGFKVSSAAAVITVLPRYGWETVNRINASISAAVSGDLTGTIAGTCEVDPLKAKVWRITLNNNITMSRPRDSYDGDRISVEFKNLSTHTVAWDINGFYFVGGTEPTVTVSSVDVYDVVFQKSRAAKFHTLTLTGTNGTGSIIMGGVTKTATFNSTLTQTATDFVTANAAAYLAAGITLTSSGADLIFTIAATGNSYLQPPRFTNLTLTLNGTVVTTNAGRWLVTNSAQDIKQ